MRQMWESGLDEEGIAEVINELVAEEKVKKGSARAAKFALRKIMKHYDERKA